MHNRKKIGADIFLSVPFNIYINNNYYLLIFSKLQYGKLQFKKMTCFQTTATFGPNGDVNISSGRSDWNYFIPIVVVNAASTNMIQASPNGNSIYLYCAMLAEKTIEVNVVCFGK